MPVLLIISIFIVERCNLLCLNAVYCFTVAATVWAIVIRNMLWFFMKFVVGVLGWEYAQEHNNRTEQNNQDFELVDKMTDEDDLLRSTQSCWGGL